MSRRRQSTSSNRGIKGVWRGGLLALVIDKAINRSANWRGLSRLLHAAGMHSSRPVCSWPPSRYAEPFRATPRWQLAVGAWHCH